ncbi:hypothetical protein PC121_g2767 [Phytophthora cactorum]|nr:hypothetical protein PC121_g2767 [Phytophthora cactorum]
MGASRTRRSLAFLYSSSSCLTLSSARASPRSCLIPRSDLSRLEILAGIGIGIGWLFKLLSTQEQSASFVSCMVMYDGVLRGNVGDGTPTYMLYGACMVGAMIAGFINFFLGRGLFSTLGVVAQRQRRSLFDAADA